MVPMPHVPYKVLHGMIITVCIIFREDSNSKSIGIRQFVPRDHADSGGVLCSWKTLQHMESQACHKKNKG
jgi:hypothetical protein